MMRRSIGWIAAAAIGLAMSGTASAEKVNPFKALQEERPSMLAYGMLRLELLLRDFAAELNRAGRGAVEMRPFYRKEQSHIVLQVLAHGMPTTRENCRDRLDFMRRKAEIDPRDGVRTSFRFASIYARQFVEPGTRELDRSEVLLALDNSFVIFVQIVDESKQGPGSRIICEGPLYSAEIVYRN
ncbi:MAG: hypothetical protein AB7P50_07400 [Alphaproteobacteria bacterium]